MGYISDLRLGVLSGKFIITNDSKFMYVYVLTILTTMLLRKYCTTLLCWYLHGLSNWSVCAHKKSNWSVYSSIQYLVSGVVVYSDLHD